MNVLLMHTVRIAGCFSDPGLKTYNSHRSTSFVSYLLHYGTIEFQRSTVCCA
jgi:hypothetical protein